MIDFHVHVGEGLNVAEALFAAGRLGYRGVGLLVSQLNDLAGLRAQARNLSLFGRVETVVGATLSHVPPALMPEMVEKARAAGAAYVLVHGEGFEEAEPGTNFAAVEAGADILANPGLVDSILAAYAAEKSVALELSSAPKGAYGNGLTALRAKESGAMLIVGGEVHKAADFASSSLRRHVCAGSGLQEEMLKNMESTYRNLWRKFAEQEKS